MPQKEALVSIVVLFLKLSQFCFYLIYLFYQMTLVCLFQGSFFLFLPSGLTLFAIFYTFGNVCALCRYHFMLFAIDIFHAWLDTTMHWCSHGGWGQSWFQFIYKTSYFCVVNRFFTGFEWLYWSTCFLMGPCEQLKRMFSETRLIATTLVLVSLFHNCELSIWTKVLRFPIGCLLLWFQHSSRFTFPKN